MKDIVYFGKHQHEVESSEIKFQGTCHAQKLDKLLDDAVKKCPDIFINGDAE